MVLPLRLRGALLAAVALTLAACAPSTSLVRPDYASRSEAIGRVAVLPPDVRVYLVSVGGMVEQMDEETDAAQGLVTETVRALLARETPWQGRVLPADSLAEQAGDALRETQGLFDAVNASLQRHVYGEPRERLPTLAASFDVTVGPEAQALAPGADALLFVWGVDYRATAGRNAAKVGATVAAALFGVVTIPQGEPTGLSLALVHPQTGDVLWYTHVRAQGGSGFKSAASIEQMVRTALRRLPGR